MRNDGARASAALVHLHQGPRPLDPFRRNFKLGKAEYFRQFRLISPPMKFPPQAVIGGSSGPEAITSPSRASFQSTAGVCFLLRSSSIRLCGSRGIIPLVRSGLKVQRNPFACLPIVIICPSYRCC